MHLARPALLALALALPTLLAASPAPADEPEEVDDEFDTSWFGARLGVWYRPSIDMEVQISGRNRAFAALNTLGLLGTPLDVHNDLGVTENATSDFMIQNGVLEAELFFDTRWVSISAWAIPPFQYEGETVLSRTISFGGQSFTASTPVESKFRQFFLGADVKLNLLNNEFVRLSPIVALRAIGIDWEIRAPQFNLKGDTSDIDTPLHYSDAAVAPYPELGLEVRLGIRKWFEVDLRATGSYIDYFNTQGNTLLLDAGITGYPIPYVGVRLGARYMELDIHSQTDRPDEQFDFDLEFLGATLSVIVRFG